MSSQPTPDNRRRRRKLYSQLTQLLAKLTPRSPESFSQENLQSLGIQCSAMTLLPEEDPNAGPLYCELVAPRVMDEAFDNYWAEQDADDGPPQWPRPPKYTNIFYNAYAVAGTIGDYIASLSYVYDTEWCETGETSPALTFHRNQYPGTYRQWGVCGILRVESSKQPHLACMHVDDAPPEEGLRPSELLSAIKLMKQAVKLDKHDRFPIYPIYVYSFSDHKARILETFYESGTLFVRKTPYVDFAEEDKEKIKLFLRWMLNRPISPATLASRKDFAHVSDDSSEAEIAVIQP